MRSPAWVYAEIVLQDKKETRTPKGDKPKYLRGALTVLARFN